MRFRMSVMHAICMLIAVGGLALAACNGATVDGIESAPSAATATVPDEITLVRDAAADYIRESAAICAPPEGATWRVDTADASLTPGATVYRFVSADCTLTVAGPAPLPADARFYVAYRNEATAFCWQGLIDVTGEVLATGYEQRVPGLDNPAQIYCETQGHRFEVLTREDGTLCAACVFADGSSCNAWSYLYGECAPPP